MPRIRDSLDPATLIRVADHAESCVLCGRPTTARAMTAGGEPVHYASCLYPPLWYALAKRRGAVEGGGTSWGAQT